MDKLLLVDVAKSHDNLEDDLNISSLPLLPLVVLGLLNAGLELPAELQVAFKGGVLVGFAIILF